VVNKLNKPRNSRKLFEDSNHQLKPGGFLLLWQCMSGALPMVGCLSPKGTLQKCKAFLQQGQNGHKAKTSSVFSCPLGGGIELA
jgi:hypothetical protein